MDLCPAWSPNIFARNPGWPVFAESTYSKAVHGAGKIWVIREEAKYLNPRRELLEPLHKSGMPNATACARKQEPTLRPYLLRSMFLVSPKVMDPTVHKDFSGGHNKLSESPILCFQCRISCPS